MTSFVYCFLLLWFDRFTAENPVELMLVFMLLIYKFLVWKRDEVVRGYLSRVAKMRARCEELHLGACRS